MAFWDYFRQSHAKTFRIRNVSRYILNRYIQKNSHCWATQDILKHITLRIRDLCRLNGFLYKEGFYTRTITLAQIDEWYLQAKTRAESMELHYREYLSNPVPVFRYQSELARILYNQPTRYSTDLNLIRYFKVGGL
jgi:hypothetical protein